jgi:hypothetical protein
MPETTLRNSSFFGGAIQEAGAKIIKLKRCYQ